MSLRTRGPARVGPALPTGTHGVVQRGVVQRTCACGRPAGPTGECAGCRRKRGPGLQAKLRVGRPGDRWEREAERAAEGVVRPRSASPPTLSAGPMEARPGGGCGAAAPPEVDAALATPGRPLDPDVRGFMERRFGRDFGPVRVHTDGPAARAAGTVGARAFTVGRDVAFARGEYRPGTPEGRRLLAHELAHTLQQGGGSGAPSAGGGVVQRDLPSPDAPSEPGPLTVGLTADRADASCDLKTLCRLRFTNPEVVTDARVHRVVRRCRPGLIVGRSPCLDMAVLSPELFGPLPTPAGPTATGKGAPPPPPASGLPDLAGLTKFELDVGDGKLSVDLPSSAKLNLPVEFRNSYRVTFEMVAKTSGAFSFSITLDGIPHVQLKATTTTDVAKKSVKTELGVSSALKTCHAPSPQATKAALQKAGDGLKKAIQDVNKSDAQLEAEKEAAKTGAAVTATPPEGFDRVKRLADVVSGIVDVKKAVDQAKEGCKPQPTISVGITGETPFDPGDEDAVPSTVTGGLTIRF